MGTSKDKIPLATVIESQGGWKGNADLGRGPSELHHGLNPF